MAKQIVTEQPPRCSECARLEKRDVTVLRCAACGYKAVAGAHPSPARRQPTREEPSHG